MHSFEMHSNECPCRKSGHLGLEQVIYIICIITNHDITTFFVRNMATSIFTVFNRCSFQRLTISVIPLFVSSQFICRCEKSNRFTERRATNHRVTHFVFHPGVILNNSRSQQPPQMFPTQICFKIFHYFLVTLMT